MNKYASCEFYSRFFDPALTIKRYVTSFLVDLIQIPYPHSNFLLFERLYNVRNRLHKRQPFMLYERKSVYGQLRLFNVGKNRL